MTKEQINGMLLTMEQLESSNTQLDYRIACLTEAIEDLTKEMKDSS